MAIYKNRIEIYNPGTFPEGLDTQDYIGRVERPIRRNLKIAGILYYSKNIESFGIGLRRIAEACEKAGVRYESQKKKVGKPAFFVYSDGIRRQVFNFVKWKAFLRYLRKKFRRMMLIRIKKSE